MYKKQLKHHVPQVAVLVIILAVLPWATPARVCESLSKYCSSGKLKGYIGPLDTAAQLKDALEGTAHEKELIVFSDNRLHDAAQALARFREAGWSHILAVMERPVQCQQLHSVFLPWLDTDGPISCGTYASADESGKEYPSGLKYLARNVGTTAWWRKWFTVGRAVALGYNVMAIDSDVVVLDDWYWRAKQPPLRQFNLLSQSEFGVGVNGGFSYIQNASPTGPVAWVMYEALHRAVRWAEDDSKLKAASPLYEHPDVDDQMLLRDCVHSAVAGRPMFNSLLHMLQRDEHAFERLNTTRSQVEQAIEQHVTQAWRQKETYEVTGELQERACEKFDTSECRTVSPGSVVVSTGTLRMPHSGGQWPPEFGGYPFNTPGPLTLAYRAAYKELGAPLPPDPEDPSTEKAARAAQPETAGFLSVEWGDLGCTGCWAESGWFATGRHGWWHRHLLSPSQRKMAIGHIWAGLFPGDYQKELVLMLSGLYNWHVAARLARSRQQMFFGNQGHPLAAPRIHVPVVRSVVAFAPGVVHAAMSKEQFIRAAQGLAQVAVSLGAIAAWPSVPCDSDWALTPEARRRVQRPIRHSIPWTYLQTFFQVQPFGDSLQELQCEWPGFSAASCITSREVDHIDGGRGMLAVEFHHLRNTTRAAPSPDTTLRLADPAVPPPPAGNTARQPVPYADLVRLNAQFVFGRLQRESMPVFWLDRLVEVTGMASEAADTYKRWHDRCMALRYLEIPEREREVW